MLRIAFTAADLTRVRLAHSPMVEVVTSSFALNQPDRFRMYGSWRTRVRPLVARAGLETMLAVVCGPACYVPDFLTPVPATARPSLEEEVRVLAATPLDQVAAEVATAWAGHPAPPQIARFATDPAGGLAELIQQIRRYFRLAIAPIWPRVRAVAEAEIAQRARTAAELGPRALLEDLHPQLDWDGAALRLAHAKSRDWELDGHPLALLPAGFAGPLVHTMTEAPTGRALWYPPRGYGRLLGPGRQGEPGSALAALLGPTRAAVLTLLAAPGTTGEVAAALELAPATASHHLTILRNAGLVAAERIGRRLRYLRTPLGEQLTAGSEAPSAGPPVF
ncbi:transcriptional regulator [Streptomyces sulfonofaciens]|uniref:Transcriptional regulator n=1 Tax=Streptomyces sulfonofaciens TaxID=68272 RepID=A0A919L454_9ACTN|nr:winged helix-turn-helix domain-containing protein [Streptomyces sulfonofaciens]GHH82809.1 transcriptional regulator [Streptomyces sulfonofaciens]